VTVADASPPWSKAIAVAVRGVSKRFETTIALDNVSLDIRRGEFISLLGSSGCGKTTLLRIIGGFEVPSSGDIAIGGRSVLRVPPFRRQTNMIFQQLALFPHLTVAQNVSFGLEVKRLPKSEIGRRVDAILALVNLNGYAERQINQLSGGQQQRVAIARALVNEPQVLLLDEPLGALDLRLRIQMHEELKRIHRETGSTFIFVTHDQGEAIVLSDRIAVMDSGKIAQLGTPQDIYERPQTPFVARFIGHANLIEAVIEQRNRDGSYELVSSSGRRFTGVSASQIKVGSKALLFLRYEKIGLCPEESPDGACGTVIDKTYLGSAVRVSARLHDGSVLVAEVANTDFTNSLKSGDRVGMQWPPDSAIIIPC
jgi:spermidine/putrescine transport system ATP-binding protein